MKNVSAEFQEKKGKKKERGKNYNVYVPCYYAAWTQKVYGRVIWGNVSDFLACRPVIIWGGKLNLWSSVREEHRAR